jgi:glycerol-3-phosphate dehydrogenase (NAD(P)+)
MRIAVLGAGAWGTALAHHAAQHHEVSLWSRAEQHAAAIRSERVNQRYLPGVTLHPSITASSHLREVLDWVDASPASLIVVATTVAGLRPTLESIAALRGAPPRLIWLCKGIEPSTDFLPHQVVGSVLPAAGTGALLGPSFAQEVAAGLPVALTIASRDEALATLVIEAFHFGAARIYRSNDLLGVELGGALKNIVALATGICDGLQLGANARAALITRGLAEMTRLGLAMGAKAETFMGLTGLGDLVLTCTGDLSRNRRVGVELAAGRRLADVLISLGHVAEGVACAPAAAALGSRYRVELPIVAAVVGVLGGRSAPREAVDSLLARGPTREH